MPRAAASPATSRPAPAKRSWLLTATDGCLEQLQSLDAPGEEAAEILEEAVDHFRNRRYRIAMLDCARCVESMLVLILRQEGETPGPSGGDCLQRLEKLGLISEAVGKSIHRGVFAFRNEAAHAGNYKPDANTTRFVFGNTVSALHYLFTLLR